MKPTVTFYGAAGGVTGSKHLIEFDGGKILLDCGMFQGLADVQERNRGFAFAPDEITHVVLSHAHLDHCGMLPLLVKRGFAGPIFTTPATRDVAEHMLADAAEIEVQDAAYRSKHHIGTPDSREPLITPDDIPTVIARMVPVPYARAGRGWHEISPRARLKMYDAGHILGSAVSVLDINGIRLGYTGDLGPTGMPLLHDPEVPEEDMNTLIMESTYGSRAHEGLSISLDRLAETIARVVERGGKMIVPAFSLGRTQLLVYVVHKLVDEERIPRFPIVVDSPLASDLTEVHRRYRQDFDKETWEDFGPRSEGSHTPLSFSNLTYTQSVEESKQLNETKGPLMIISASGMMTAGRVVHHLRHNISSSKNAVFITGYQAEGTLGRRLLEGAKQVDLYGDRFEVRAEVCLFNEFSAHADRVQLQEYAEAVRGLKQIALVHGEPHQADDLQAEFAAAHPAWNVVRPNEGDSIEI